MNNSRIKDDVKKIFEFWCEVTRAEKPSKHSGLIIESFPENYRDQQIITKIPEFAYPCEFSNDIVQRYSFVLTSDDSKWRFGFCQHDPKTDTAMVIVTYLPWHDTFIRLLGVLGELRRTKNGDFDTFLAEAYNKGVPDPGASLKLFYDGGQNHFTFQRPSQFQLPSILENHNLNLYYTFVNPKNMISVFASMLAERRIIFTSCHLDRLSSCVQAANEFLYPMVWQHIFIPILPMKLKDNLMAPMPYLIGVPIAVLNVMTKDELGEVVILNCDTNQLETPFDSLDDMPAELVHQMKKHLSNPHDHIGDRVSKIFLRALVQLIGGYRDAVRFVHGQRITWDRDIFIESRPSHLRTYLAKMMETQIFNQFIEERLEMLNRGLGYSDEFELETLRYAEKMGKRGRNYKEFLKNVKDKTNPAVKSAVKSVKVGSRGMKSAYKDLKSKFRDITPPKSAHFHSHISNSHHDGIDGLSGHTPGYHHSAPSSPVFSSKRQIKHDFAYASGGSGAGVSISTTTTGIRNPLAMSSSVTQIQQNGYNHNSSNNSVFGTSPAISPASSLCSSEMNISQELQNHPLFKSPVVDRSSQNQNPQPTEDAINDLISLDDSNNTSFDLEDFDPLNQNAKPIPNLHLPSTNLRPNSPAALSTKSAILPSSASSTLPSVHNPMYPYFTPQHRNTLPQKSSLSNNDDDFELLRKYGLDQFNFTSSPTLMTAAAATTTTAASTATTTSNKNNWTMFD